MRLHVEHLIGKYVAVTAGLEPGDVALAPHRAEREALSVLEQPERQPRNQAHHVLAFERASERDRMLARLERDVVPASEQLRFGLAQLERGVKDIELDPA